jgi:hypothetical protein
MKQLHSTWLLAILGCLRLKASLSFYSPAILQRRGHRQQAVSYSPGVSRGFPTTCRPPCLASPSALQSGRGVAKDYSWSEEAFELEVTVKVPVETRAKNILFKATSMSLELKLKHPNGTETLLLDPARKLRGRISVDGTYWVIGDEEDGSKTHRTVTVTIEKLIQTPADDFEIVEYDWKGVYADDSEDVSQRKYDEPEELDVRKYAASMGVDIDNIDMKMVDKEMFGSGMNLTQSAMKELVKSGYAKEVTEQADGTQYTVNDEGEPEKIPSLDEALGEKLKVPLLDTNSPWHTAVPVKRDPETNQTYVQKTRQFTREAFARDAAIQQQTKEDQPPKKGSGAADPIDTLTVKRLKEILKAQGLNSSGSKKELQDRLRSQVNSLLQGKQDPDVK